MPSTMARMRRFYGAGPLHLLLTLGSLALAAYVVTTMGWDSLWNSEVWWHSIAVWFLGAALLHDLVLFPLYALLDRVGVVFSPGRERGARSGHVNYVRVPALAVGLAFLLFFPGIVQQGAGSYLRATGQTQDPFLQRWLFFSAGCFAVSAAAYVGRQLIVWKKGVEKAPE